MQAERFAVVEVEDQRAGIAAERRAVVQDAYRVDTLIPPGARRFLL